jgi:transposase
MMQITSFLRTTSMRLVHGYVNFERTLFEGASTCHYWGRFAKHLSHDVRVIGPRKVKAFLQGQKTDANDASAYIGVTPKQYSSGGKVSMKGIDKVGGNKAFRANLFMGARAVIKALPEKPRTNKEQWLIPLIKRVGEKRACIALANKTVRTACTAC